MPEQGPAVLKLKGGEEENIPNFPAKAMEMEQSTTGEGGGIPFITASITGHHPDGESRTSATDSLRPEVAVLMVDTNALNAKTVKHAECPNTFTAEKPSIPDNETKSQKSQGVRQSLSKFFRSLSSGSSIAKRDPASGADIKSRENTSSESTATMRQRGSSYHAVILGFLLASGTSAVLSLVNVIVKRLETVSTLEVLTFMAFGVFIGILPVATEEVQPFGSRAAQPLLFARTILSLASATLRLMSLSYLTVADSSIMTSLTPLMVGLTGTLFLSERCHWTRAVATALSVVGLILLMKPPFMTTANGSMAMTQYIGIAYGLSHSVINGVTTVCIRATRGVSRSVVVFHYGCLSMLLVSIVSIAMGRLKVFYDGSQIGYLLLISHLTFALQMFLSKALDVESASFVTIVKTSSDVIFGFILQAIFLNVYPDRFSILGGSLILCGVLIIGLRKIALASDPDSGIRHRLQFLLGD
nr:pseudopaline exporter CntI-like [Rhipicephalus microplus]